MSEILMDAADEAVIVGDIKRMLGRAAPQMVTLVQTAAEIKTLLSKHKAMGKANLSSFKP